MNRKAELTGNKRLRAVARLFRTPILVLQVEEHIVGETMHDIGNRIESKGYDITIWRDARTEDLPDL